MFSSKLKELRKAKGLSMEELAERYNKQFNGRLNKSTLSRYENNLQEPMITVVRNLASLFGVTVGFLSDNESPPAFNIFSLPNIHPVQLRKIPMLGEVACGIPIYVEEDKEHYSMTDCDIKADFCLTAKGDSMINADINDGDIVFIKNQPIVDDGEIAVVLIDDEVTLKRVYRDEHSITLVAENSKYRPMVYTDEGFEDVRILGKAIAIQRVIG